MIGCFYKRGQVRVEGRVFGVDLVDFGVVDGHEGRICFFRVERQVISFPGVYMASSSFAWERLISCPSTRVISGLLFRMVTRSFNVVYCSEVKSHWQASRGMASSLSGERPREFAMNEIGDIATFTSRFVSVLKISFR